MQITRGWWACREAFVCGVRGLISLLLSLPVFRNQLAILAAEVVAHLPTALLRGTDYSSGVLTMTLNQSLALLLSFQFVLSITLPVRIWLQLPLSIASAAVLKAVLLADGSCTSCQGLLAAAPYSERSAACLRSLIITVLGIVVAPAICQFTIERKSRQDFASGFPCTAL